MLVTALPVQITPLLCCDTCSILDIMRDPTRDTSHAVDRQAVLDVLTAAEAGRIRLLIPQQVSIEFAAHDQGIQDEADRAIARARATIERVNAIAGIYGVAANIDLSHLDDHVTRARAIVARWLTCSEVIEPSSQAPLKAFARVNAGIAPAKQGKDSSKDCLVYETLIEIAEIQRRLGFALEIVFLSSNINEYTTPGTKLIQSIATDFAALGISYVPNMRAARYFLGL